MPIGTEVGLGPGHIVLDENPAPQGYSSPPLFGPCLLWPNGWMDQDTIPLGTEIGLGPSDIVLDGIPNSPQRKGAQQPPTFRPMHIVAKRWLISATNDFLF